MIDAEDRTKNLKEEILPVGFIKSGFIRVKNKKGDYSYEDYLREFMNKSEHFLEKSGGAEYVKPRSESHGEADALSDKYAIDFKLILGESMQRVKDLTSAQIDTNGKGAFYYSVSKGEGEYKAIWLHRALRDFSEEELTFLMSGVIEKDDLIKKDIMSFVKSIMKPKHLLLLYPALLTYEGQNRCSREDVFEAMYDDYKHSLAIRQKEFPERDTYIAAFFEGDLIIGQYRRDAITFVDAINSRLSKTFMYIANVYDLNTTVIRLMRAARDGLETMDGNMKEK